MMGGEDDLLPLHLPPPCLPPHRYLKISISDFLTLFSARTRRPFWERGLGKALGIAACFALGTSTIFALFWGDFIIVKSDPMASLRHSKGAILATWMYCVLWWIAQDCVKVRGGRTEPSLLPPCQHSPPRPPCCCRWAPTGSSTTSSSPRTRRTSRTLRATTRSSTCRPRTSPRVSLPPRCHLSTCRRHPLPLLLEQQAMPQPSLLWVQRALRSRRRRLRRTTPWRQSCRWAAACPMARTWQPWRRQPPSSSATSLPPRLELARRPLLLPDIVI